ncbi:methionine/alanine import family NSS transporter small subunit [Microbacterium halotolerans]|nr:methionine/alanine import family NSS transporter small subunit [Microbacterium halotolerans]
MSAIAVTFLIIAAVVIWGGLISSAVFLARKPETAYPEGGAEDESDVE